MDGGFYTISLTAKNMYLSWGWCRRKGMWRLPWYTGTIFSWVTDGQYLALEVRFPIRVELK